MARRRNRGRPVHGILLLDKPIGITSNKALQIARRCYDAAKAGHTGSLDPAASGLLPLCFGEATKVSGYLLDADKEYETVAHFGIRTDTADADGNIVERSDLNTVTPAQLEGALAALRGPIEQVPPMYSALRHEGQRLYKLAREGAEVERQARPVTIHELEVVDFDPQQPRLRVRCSKGTYIRTLVEDIAAQLGTVAHVAALHRTAVGPFGGQDMTPLATVEALAGDAAALDALLLPVDSGLQAFPALQLGPTEAFYVVRGQPVAVADAPDGLVRLYGDGGTLLGMGEVAGGQVAPKRLFPGLLEGPPGAANSEKNP
ncbi:MAG: tRNA pseudouridine(55) synthase TruB [Gammaproteobacteria bacterium]|nr:tRNA pseudouridine(55) synthase TruB [Gammaproteobacteria bacterium]